MNHSEIGRRRTERYTANRLSYERGPFRVLALAYCALIPLGMLPLFLGKSPVAIVAGLMIFTFLSVPLTRVQFDGMLALLCAFFFFWMALGIYWSEAPAVSALSSVSYAADLVTAVALTQALILWPKKVMQAIVVGSALFSLALIATRVLSGSHSGITTVLELDPNYTSQGLVLGLAISISNAIILNERPLLFGGAAALIAAGMVTTGSRTAILATIVMFTVAVAFTLMKRRRRLRAIAASGTALAFGYYAWDWGVRTGFVPERAQNLVSDIQEGNDSERGIILDAYAAHASDWLNFGIGAGAGPDYLHGVANLSMHAHNLFWRTTIELGLVGLVILLFILVRTIFLALRSKEVAPLVMVGLAGQFAFFWLLGGELAANFWFLLALAVSSKFLPSSSTRDPEPRTGVMAGASPSRM